MLYPIDITTDGNYNKYHMDTFKMERTSQSNCLFSLDVSLFPSPATIEQKRYLSLQGSEHKLFSCEAQNSIQEL